MSIVAWGFARTSTNQIGPAVWGYTIKTGSQTPPVASWNDFRVPTAPVPILQGWTQFIQGIPQPPAPIIVADTHDPGLPRKKVKRKHIKLSPEGQVQRSDLDAEQTVRAGLIEASARIEGDRMLSALSATWRLEDVKTLEGVAKVLTQIIIDEDNE